MIGVVIFSDVIARKLLRLCFSGLWFHEADRKI